MITRPLFAKAFLFLLLATSVAACTAAPKRTETYTDSSGSVLYFDSDRDACTRSCNAEYDRCGETKAANSRVGKGQLTGVFGGEADCKDSLRSCLAQCKSR